MKNGFFLVSYYLHVIALLPQWSLGLDTERSLTADVRAACYTCFTFGELAMLVSGASGFWLNVDGKVMLLCFLLFGSGANIRNGKMKRELGLCSFLMSNIWSRDSDTLILNSSDSGFTRVKTVLVVILVVGPAKLLNPMFKMWPWTSPISHTSGHITRHVRSQPELMLLERVG